MGDVLGTRINWELRKAMLTAPPDVKHFAGTLRCIECGLEDKCLIQAPLWAATPPTTMCEHEECDGLMVFVSADADAPEDDPDHEPYEYLVILPEDRDKEPG